MNLLLCSVLRAHQMLNMTMKVLQILPFSWILSFLSRWIIYIMHLLMIYSLRVTMQHHTFFRQVNNLSLWATENYQMLEVFHIKLTGKNSQMGFTLQCVILVYLAQSEMMAWKAKQASIDLIKMWEGPNTNCPFHLDFWSSKIYIDSWLLF